MTTPFFSFVRPLAVVAEGGQDHPRAAGPGADPPPAVCTAAASPPRAAGPPRGDGAGRAAWLSSARTAERTIEAYRDVLAAS